MKFLLSSLIVLLCSCASVKAVSSPEQIFLTSADAYFMAMKTSDELYESGAITAKQFLEIEEVLAVARPIVKAGARDIGEDGDLDEVELASQLAAITVTLIQLQGQ